MKNNIIKVVIALIFLVLFNGLFFFLCGTEQSASTWISYGFIHLAYLCILVTPLLSKSGNGLEVLTYSLYSRALAYFSVELLVGVVCIIVDPVSPTWPVVIQSILFAIFLIMQLMSVLANDSTTKSIRKQANESLYIRGMAQRLQVAMRNINDPEVEKIVVRCYEAVNNSPLQSFPEAVNAELYLREAVDALCCAIEEGDKSLIEKKAKDAIYAVQDRNAVIRKCRINY